MRVDLNTKRSHLRPGAYRTMTTTDKEFHWANVPGAIWKFLGEDRGRFAFFNILLFVVFFYELVPAYVMGKVIDFFTHYHAGDSLRTFYSYVIFLGVSYIVIALIRLKSKNMLTKIGIATRSRAKIMGFERLMDASIEWHNQENTGNKVQRILTGSTALYEISKLTSNNLYFIFVNFIGISIFYLLTDWVFFAFLLAYVAVFFTILFAYNKKMEAISIESDRALEQSSGTYFEGAGNVLSIKAVGAESSVHSRIKAHETSFKNLQFALTDTNNTKWRLFQVWNGLAYAALLLLIGRQVLTGTVSIGLILVIYTYFNRFRDSANDANDISTALVGFKVDIGRLVHIFKEKSAVRSGTKDFPASWDALHLSRIDFAYPNGQVGLSRFTLDVPRGSRIGIAGSSGSGKSTLVRILVGLYEVKAGSFTVGQTDFYQISRDQVTQNIAIVLQETELFNLSLKDNITTMRDFDADLFARAIHIADLEGVISRLPEGPETIIGERGYNLSGGERQRIGIARAIYKNAPILLLDEATSALDSQTEKNIVDRLTNELDKDKTFIIVAHRLSTLKNADQIIVLDQGETIETGNFNELIADSRSRLSKLYALQSNKA